MMINFFELMDRSILITLLGFTFFLQFSFAQVEEISDDKLIHTNAEVNASFLGGNKAFGLYLMENLHYPKEAVKKGIEGQVYVQLVVDQIGNISEVTALRGIGFGCNEEAVRVVENSPKWTPGMENGKSIKQRVVVPIAFRLDNAKNVKATIIKKPSRNRSNNKKIKSKNRIKTDASFIGGEKAFQDYLKANLRYPDDARHKGIEGKVHVQFIIDENGEISEVEAVIKIRSDCDKEAVRLIKTSPTWNPGKLKDGTLVKQLMIIPISFKLR